MVTLSWRKGWQLANPWNARWFLIAAHTLCIGLLYIILFSIKRALIWYMIHMMSSGKKVIKTHFNLSNVHSQVLHLQEAVLSYDSGWHHTVAILIPVHIPCTDFLYIILFSIKSPSIWYIIHMIHWVKIWFKFIKMYL